MGMERYRAIVKLEDIRTLFENGRYEEAKAAADGLRRERLKDSTDLFLLSALYRKCGEYETAKEFLLRIYEKKATWRVLEELMEVCLAEKNPKEAGAYLKEYCRISGGDPRNYIYEYRIGRQMHWPDEELLPILQTLKAEEYTEKYGYELAKLYHKLGREQECMAECADLVLWFGEGTYVERAKALQAYYRGELSAEDIRTRSSQKEEEQRRFEEEERRRQEEELRRFEEEERRRQEEELRRFEEEERGTAEEELYRFEEKERRAAEEEPYRFEEEGRRAAEEEPYRFEEEEYRTAEEAERNGETEAWNQGGYAPTEAKESSLFQRGLSEQGKENLQKALEEMAATDMDGSMGGPVSVWMAGKDTVTGEAVYEQISLFPSEEEPEEKKMSVPVSEEPEGAPAQEVMSGPANEELEEEPVWEEPEEALTELNAELAFCLSANGVVFEEALHGYARVERVRKQLIQVLGMLLAAKKRCHCLVITGGKQSGKTMLGTYLVKLLYELSYLNSPRVAKISAAKLNQLRLSEKSRQLRDCCLVIESAGDLTAESVAGLMDFIGEGVLSAVILEDNANAMNQLLRGYTECNRTFNNRIHLPEYSRGELMSFALEYISSHDYEIGREARRILERKIEQVVRTEKKERRLAETMETVVAAIENADYRNQGTILTMAAAGNLLAAGAMELAAEDFGVIR